MSDSPAIQPAPALRPVYSVEEFAREILGGHRRPNWIREMCRWRKIKTVASRPWLIPQSEAVRFMGGGSDPAGKRRV